VTNEALHVSIRDHGGVERFRLGEESATKLTAIKPFGDTYQGVFLGFTVEASIDPRVSRQIVIGGMPRSRLPFFLGLLALNAGLIVTAILQLRREMALQQLRDEFVSSVSHELRTPLTQIRMFTETLMLDRIRSTEEHRRSLEIIDREARRLTQLVENVLQFSRTERKTDSLSKEKRELAPLIQEIVEDFESVMNGSGARIEFRLSSGLSANVDPDAVRQIVINLLDNAAKYGKRKQLVIMGLEARDGMACLFVDDEGPGVPVGDRKRIFDRFQRLERDRQSIAGTGIGLSVVRDLVIRHGGRCSVTTGDRGGAKFVVELPLFQAVEGARKEQPEESP
jgi:two-component system phosphate regulon sensor histidine kinase PhoR